MKLTPLQICHRCEFRRRPCAGPCECQGDEQKRDIMVLSRTGTCPKGKFTTADVPAPDSRPPLHRGPEPTPPAAVPRDEWPAYISAIAAFATTADKGVGDIIHRGAAMTGMDTLIKNLNLKCGCARRRAEMNAKYPL